MSPLKQGHPFYYNEPQASKVYITGYVCQWPGGAKITRVTHQTDQGTVAWNLLICAEDDPHGSTGTAVWSVNKTASSTMTTETGFNNDTLTQYQRLCLVTGSVATTEHFWVTLYLEAVKIGLPPTIVQLNTVDVEIEAPQLTWAPDCVYLDTVELGVEPGPLQIITSEVHYVGRRRARRRTHPGRGGLRRVDTTPPAP